MHSTISDFDLGMSIALCNILHASDDFGHGCGWVCMRRSDISGGWLIADKTAGREWKIALLRRKCRTVRKASGHRQAIRMGRMRSGKGEESWA
jgi:hypothetical protein